MALDLGACRRMIDSCKEHGVKLAIGHTLRFYPAFLTCRRLVGEGAIGTPVSGSIDRLGASPLRPGARENGDATEEVTWRSDPALFGGHMLEGFIHEIDVTRSVFGEVSSVMCELAGNTVHDGLMSPDLAEALARFESGALVTMRAGATVALPTRGYWFAGTEGGLRFTEWRGPVEHFRHDSEDVQLISCDPLRAYALELEDLLGAVESGDEPQNSGDEPQNSGTNGLKNVALALGMYHSFETGHRVKFVDGKPDGLPEDYRNTKW
jgi:predicted dehydrogenase